MKMLKLFTIVLFLSSPCLVVVLPHVHADDTSRVPVEDNAEYSESEVEEHRETDAEGGAEEEGEEEEYSPAVGPDKAIIEVNLKLQSFRLSSKAIESIDLKTSLIKSVNSLRNEYEIPITGLVTFRDRAGVYQIQEGWIQLVEVVVTKKGEKNVWIRTESLNDGDLIAVSKVGFLRVSQLEAFREGAE